MAELPRCHDCAAAPCTPHEPGCDVERCIRCGWQAINCDCNNRDTTEFPPTIWTGRWPGLVEVEEYGLRDLNELAILCARGVFTWDSDAERWRQGRPFAVVAPVVTPPPRTQCLPTRGLP